MTLHEHSMDDQALIEFLACASELRTYRKFALLAYARISVLTSPQRVHPLPTHRRRYEVGDIRANLNKT